MFPLQENRILVFVMSSQFVLFASFVFCPVFADQPQVQAIHRYVAEQPDELSLEESDVINVFKKVSDGKVNFSEVSLVLSIL